MLEDRRHKRRRHQRKSVWWASETFYKPIYLTRAIASGHHLDVLDFVSNKDISTVHVNNADRSGLTPFHAALLAEDPYSLGALMTVAEAAVASDDQEAFEPAASSYILETAHLHCGISYQGLPGLHVGLVNPPPCSPDLAKCFVLLLYQKLQAAAKGDDSIEQLLEEVDTDVVKCLPAPLNWRGVGSTVDLEIEDSDGFTLLERCAERADNLLCRILVRAGARLRNSLTIACASSALTNDQTNVVANFNFLLSEFKQQNLFDRACVLRALKIGIKNLAWACVSELLKLCDLSLTEFESLADYADTLNVSSEWVSLVDKSIDDGELAAPASALHAGKQLSLVTHKGCIDHLAVEPASSPLAAVHKENPHRLEVLLEPGKGILASRLDSQNHDLYTWREITSEAAWADITRVHDSGYVQKIAKLADAAKASGLEIKADDDTTLSCNSFHSARCAAQTVISAIKNICLDQNSRNSFCCIRPPGHHVGTHGPCQATEPSDDITDDATGSLGFCLLNNIAIAAAWARYNLYDHGIRRIAIVDFDIHHGNGTESIIRNLTPHVRRLQIKQSLGFGMSMSASLECDVDKIWRELNDSEDILFVSIHGYDGSFYPGTGESGRGDGGANIVNIGISEQMSREDFLHEFRTGVIGSLISFGPDLILVSAGFDGHVLDTVGGCKFGRLTERDFEKMTRALQRVANTFCRGRLVSVLEGGYNTTLGQASPFARCVYAHVRALATTFGSYQAAAAPEPELSSRASSYDRPADVVRLPDNDFREEPPQEAMEEATPAGEGGPGLELADEQGNG